MPFNIIRQDITKLKVDAIVNAANTGLQEGGGVCGAIFDKAGREEMRAACDAIGSCPEGGAVITPGFDLPARYVIHTVGPVWHGGKQGEEDVLRSAYRSSLELAKAHGLESIAFPLISTGVYGYPWNDGMAVALDEVQEFLLENEMDVTIVLYGLISDPTRNRLREDLSRYLYDNLSQGTAHTQMYNAPQRGGRISDAMKMGPEAPQAPYITRPSTPINFPAEQTFSQTLLKLIDAKGLTDPQAYKRSNVDRKLFSKIRSDDHYIPKKSTVLAFTIGLGLSVDEAIDLMGRAGYAFSPWHKRDLIVRYFLEHGLHDIARVNAALFEYDQELLGF